MFRLAALFADEEDVGAVSKGRGENVGVAPVGEL